MCGIIEGQSCLTPVHVSVLKEYTSTVTQRCASTLQIQMSGADDFLFKTQMLPWHNISPPLRFYGNNNHPVEFQLRHKFLNQKGTSGLLKCNHNGRQISPTIPQ